MNQFQEKFNFLKPKLDKVAATVNKVSYKKLGFIVLLSILALSIFMSIGSAIIGSIKESNAKNEQIEKAENLKTKTFLIQQLAKNTPEQFNDFIRYLKYRETIYDSRFLLISDSLIKAEQIDPKNTYNAFKNTRSLKEYIETYKQNLEEKIASFQNIYININGKEQSDSVDYKTLMTFYNSYQSNVIFKDNKIESEMNDYLYPSANFSGNRNYILKENILEKYNALENIVLNGFTKK